MKMVDGAEPTARKGWIAPGGDETEPCIPRAPISATPASFSTSSSLQVLIPRRGRQRFHISLLVVSLVVFLAAQMMVSYSGIWIPGGHEILVSPFADADDAKLFVDTVQQAYRSHVCKQKETGDRRMKGGGPSCGAGGTILSLDCADGVAQKLLKKYFLDLGSTLICADEIIVAQDTARSVEHDSSTTSSGSPLQAALESKYDAVLLYNTSKNTLTAYGANFWKNMIVANKGFLAIHTAPGNTEIYFHGKDDKAIQRLVAIQAEHSADITVDAISPSSKEASEFLGAVKELYRKQICNLCNKQGEVCKGNVLSLNCHNGLGPRLVLDYVPGQATLFCSDKMSVDQEKARSDDASRMIVGRRVHVNVPVQSRLQQQGYDLLLLDGSTKHVFENLHLWSELLAPGGILALSGKLASSATALPDALLAPTSLRAPNEEFPLILVKPSGASSDLQVIQDRDWAKDHFQANQGSVGAQIQVSPMSFEDRYAPLYQQASRTILSKHCHAKDTGNGDDCTPIKVLSFGCSYGFEMKSLADKYLTGKADIYGVDINRNVVLQARTNMKEVETNQMVVLDANEDAASNYGPFDVVFANSVLCYNDFPEPPNPAERILEVFPFSVFQALLKEIDQLVRVGGLLSLVNTNYQFQDTQLFLDKYEVFAPDEKPTCRRIVWLLSPDGKILFHPTNERSRDEHCLFIKVRE